LAGSVQAPAEDIAIYPHRTGVHRARRDRNNVGKTRNNDRLCLESSRRKSARYVAELREVIPAPAAHCSRDPESARKVDAGSNRHNTGKVYHRTLSGIPAISELAQIIGPNAAHDSIRSQRAFVRGSGRHCKHTREAGYSRGLEIAAPARHSRVGAARACLTASSRNGPGADGAASA